MSALLADTHNCILSIFASGLHVSTYCLCCCTIGQYGEQRSVPSLACCRAQDAEAFVKKCNDSGGDFELFVYDDAGHAFLTAEDHRESK